MPPKTVRFPSAVAPPSHLSSIVAKLEEYSALFVDDVNARVAKMMAKIQDHVHALQIKKRSILRQFDVRAKKMTVREFLLSGGSLETVKQTRKKDVATTFAREATRKRAAITASTFEPPSAKKAYISANIPATVRITRSKKKVMDEELPSLPEMPEIPESSASTDTVPFKTPAPVTKALKKVIPGTIGRRRRANDTLLWSSSGSPVTVDSPSTGSTLVKKGKKASIRLALKDREIGLDSPSQVKTMSKKDRNHVRKEIESMMRQLEMTLEATED
eukprot:TRINITY_DN20_c0_g1_i6.p1 TRINITY_DN20_c0_g1~~TRINITY_DN20_c0_g1_i6.p1  ORF type:complete len:274 (-),score=50.60 TRINITY_DN20_c0_g1_i6:47-868(-)